MLSQPFSRLTIALLASLGLIFFSACEPGTFDQPDDQAMDEEPMGVDEDPVGGGPDDPWADPGMDDPAADEDLDQPGVQPEDGFEQGLENIERGLEEISSEAQRRADELGQDVDEATAEIQERVRVFQEEIRRDIEALQEAEPVDDTEVTPEEEPAEEPTM